MRHMCLLLCLLTLLSCRDVTREPLTFRCVVESDETMAAERAVLFHYNQGFLYLQNDEGGAENVCNRMGTLACRVDMTQAALSLNQTVEHPSCLYRSVTNTSLDIDRDSGAFRLVQEGCDPVDDVILTGVCRTEIIQPETAFQD